VLGSADAGHRMWTEWSLGIANACPVGLSGLLPFLSNAEYVIVSSVSVSPGEQSMLSRRFSPSANAGANGLELV